MQSRQRLREWVLKHDLAYSITSAALQSKRAPLQSRDLSAYLKYKRTQRLLFECERLYDHTMHGAGSNKYPAYP